MTSGNLPSASVKDVDSRRKRPRSGGSNSPGQGSPEEILSKKGRKVGPSLPVKLQQTPPSTMVPRTERPNKRTPSPLKRSMSSQEGPSPSKRQGSKRMQEKEEKKRKVSLAKATESSQKSKGNSKTESAISARSYMACFIERRKHIKLAILEELTSPQQSPVSIQKIENVRELFKKALEFEENAQSSNQLNLENQADGLRDTDNVSGRSKLDDPALSNEKVVDVGFTCASDPKEEVPQFPGSGVAMMPLDANVSRQRNLTVGDGTHSNADCDFREPFEGNSIKETVEKNLTASGEPDSEHGKCNNTRKGLGPGYIDGAGGSEKLLLCNGCNRSFHESSIPSSTAAAPGVLRCHACVGRKGEVSRFAEYWVPALISNVQLEQYCKMLLSNALHLSSSSRSGPVGALHDILIYIRKCCDHPYIADPNLPSLFSEDVQATEYLDIGIKTSGKLVLLDKLLVELKNQKMRVLVLFQHIGGCSDTTGDILDDYMRQRFGSDSYERIDSGLLSSRAILALKMFNQIKQGRFVFLLEDRACHPRIKLSSVDAVIIFDSSWNPINDLRNLQKLSLESKLKQIKVFRLYSPFTVEEKVLVNAKQGTTWDSKLLSVNSSNCQMLLMWGASYLMKKLEEFHSSSNTSYINDSDQKLTEDVVKEFLTLLPFGREETLKSSCIITKPQVGVMGYSTDSLLHGESLLQLESEMPPQIFWSRLLNGKFLRWKYIPVSSQRNRKKVKLDGQFTDESGKSRKKIRRKMMNKSTALPPKNPGTEKGMRASKEGIHVFSPSSLPGKDRPLSPESRNVEQDERTKLIDAQKSLHVELNQEILRLSEVLELSDDVRVVVEIFLDYVINNHQLPREPATILQAFQLALCWTSASLLKEKMERKISLELSQRQLSYSCSREEVDCIYMRLRDLKKLFLATLETSDSIGSSKAPELLTKVVKVNRPSAKPLHPAAASHDVSAERIGATSGTACSSSEVLTSHKVRDINQLNGCADNPRGTANPGPSLEMKRDEISQDYEAEKASLEKTYSLEVAIVRLHLTGSKMKEKLEMLKKQHAEKLKELELAHSTAENHLQRGNESFSVQGDKHSYERMALPEENTDEIDSAPFQSTEQNARINVHDVENGDSEISRASSVNHALASTSSTRVASLQDEDDRADSESTSGIAKGASDGLQDGAGRKRNHQGNAHPRNSCVVVLALTKETSGETVKDALPGASDPLFRKENMGSASNDLLRSQTSVVEVFVAEPVTIANVMEGLPSEVAPPGTSGLPGVEAFQYDQGRESPAGDCHVANHTSAICSVDGQNHDGSGILLPDEAGRATTCNVLPRSQDETISSKLRSDACEDLHHEVASTRECLLNTIPEVSEEDGNKRIQEQQDNMQEREVESPHPCSFTSPAVEERNEQSLEPQNLPHRETEAPDSQTNISTENAGAEVEPVLEQDISRYASLSEGPPNIPVAGAVENGLLGDASLSQQMPTGSQGPCNSHMPPSQTSSQLISNSVSGTLGPRGAPVGPLFMPNRLPLQTTIQHVPGIPFPPREADPLENEYEKIRKEAEHAGRTYNELKLRLISERDREIQEMLAQINMKFGGKLKEAEAEYDLKKTELDLHMNRVFMNKMLAAAFRRKCMDLKSSTSRSGQRGGTPADLAQQFPTPSSARYCQRQTLIPSSRGPPPLTSQGSAIPPTRFQGIPPAVLNPQNRAPHAPPINYVLSQSPRVASTGPLLNPVSLSGTLLVPNGTSPTMVGHASTVEPAHTMAPHLQHLRPQGSQVLPRAMQDLVNRHVNLATRAPPLPTMHATNQVLPLEAVASSQIRNFVPWTGGGTDFFSFI